MTGEGPQTTAIWTRDAEPSDEVRDEVRTQGGARRGTVRYDTSDLVLEQHGLTLELEDRGELRLWRLTLPRGEQVEAPAAPAGVPRRLAALLDTLLGDDDLRRVPTRSVSPEIHRLEEQLLAQRRSLVTHDAGTRLRSTPRTSTSSASPAAACARSCESRGSSSTPTGRPS